MVNLRLAGSRDGTTFAGQLTGSEGAYDDLLNLDHRHTEAVRSFPCDALEAAVRTYVYRAVIHNLPEHFAFLIENKSGQALASSGNEVRYRINKYASA